METTKQQKDCKRVLYLLSILIFIIFTLIFNFFNDEINSIHKWVYSSELSEKNYEQDSNPTTITKAAGKQTNTPGKPAINTGEPVVSNLPKTPPCSILIMDKEPEFNDNSIPLFPDLRAFTGKEWTKEKTEIRMAYFNKYIYLFCRCHDAEPAKLITKYSKKEGDTNVWKDDSIELFLMKDKKSEKYCQYIVSASKLGHTFYFCKKTSDAALFQNSPLPENFIYPYYRVSVSNEGFDIFMKISIQNLEINEPTDGNSVFIQFVRNYRGNETDSVDLQLFPNHIYCDNRLDKNNHDLRAFQPIKFILPQAKTR